MYPNVPSCRNCRPAMTLTSSILPTQAEWLHLFRALLRESSYLPDPIARKYMRRYVVSSYRNYVPKYPKAEVEVTPQRQIRLRRRAKKTLSVLERANEGYNKPLERVLLLSYGRIGERRRELLQPLTAQPIPSDDAAVKSLSTKFSDRWEPPPTLMALLKNQARHRHVALSKLRPQFKQFRPLIPKENTWGRPTPWKRRKNIRRKWYAKALDSVYPPLPSQEWELLQGLVNGTVPWSLPKRRKAPERKETPPGSPPILHPEFLVTGPKKGFTFQRWSRGRPHIITSRFMQRVWNRISVLCPAMTWEPSQETWNIQWGSAKAGLPLALEQKKSSSLFNGVDSKGKTVKSSES